LELHEQRIADRGDDVGSGEADDDPTAFDERRGDLASGAGHQRRTLT
jgi:hypothetical protein